jgi:hypothetical protein
MKHSIRFLFLSLLTLSSCNLELVKWEFTALPEFRERGTFEKTGLLIHKSISINDIIAKLNLKQGVEIKSIKITSASLIITITDSPNLADSIKYRVNCDAIPLQPTHEGVAAIKKGDISGQLEFQTIKLGPISLKAIDLVNTSLATMLQTGNPLKFSVTANTLPSGSVIPVDAYLSIDFFVTYWECIEKPELTVFDNRNKGICN